MIKGNSDDAQCPELGLTLPKMTKMAALEEIGCDVTTANPAVAVAVAVERNLKCRKIVAKVKRGSQQPIAWMSHWSTRS